MKYLKYSGSLWLCQTSYWIHRPFIDFYSWFTHEKLWISIVMSVDQRVWIFKGISPTIPIFVGRTIGMGTYFQANPHGVLPKKRMGHDYTLNESIATNIGWQLLNCTCWKLLKTGSFQVQTMEPHVQRVQLIMSHVYVILVICTHTHIYTYIIYIYILFIHIYIYIN